MLLYHTSLAINPLTSQEVPVPTNFTNSKVHMAKFSDLSSFKACFTDQNGLKAQLVNTNFTGCCVILEGQCDDVAKAIASWSMPLVNSTFAGIPVVVTLPDSGGACLVEARSTFRNLALVDNRANPSLFTKLQQPISYLAEHSQIQHAPRDQGAAVAVSMSG